MVAARKIWRRLRGAIEFDFRPDFELLRSRLAPPLRGHFGPEDSPDKTAIVIAGSEWLARLLGLEKTRQLVLDYPDFTLENLALLSGEYDFVIADRSLHRCDNLDDAAREILRVLRPGGRFAVTACSLDLASDAPFDSRRLGAAGLRRLFGADATEAAGDWGGTSACSALSWLAGRKPDTASSLTPTVVTRKARRRHYRFAPRPAKFGIVAMMRNEAPYLLEWIAHYRLLGFQQITIYDNESNDASARILGPLARAGIVNAVFWPDQHAKQRRAYSRAARKLKPFVEWCLFADLDEFLVLDPGCTLDSLVPQDPAITAIGIPWRMYGSGGARNRTTGLTIERFTRGAAANDPHVKCLVRLQALRIMGIHLPAEFSGRLVDIAGAPIPPSSIGMLERPAAGIARINHYFTRSWEEFECKRARGRGAVQGQFRSAEAFALGNPDEAELREALPLVAAVRREVAELRKLAGLRPSANLDSS